MAAMQGISEDIQRMGRWKSQAFNKYIVFPCCTCSKCFSSNFNLQCYIINSVFYLGGAQVMQHCNRAISG